MLPDAELVGLALLEARGPTVTSLPAKMHPPIILIERVGGQPDLETYSDHALLQITTYGATRPLAWELANQCQMDILASPLTMVAGVLIEDAEILAGGQQQPDLDPDDRRVIFTASLQLDLRAAFTAS